jgi:response regulator RpfG family c-di-GMP phosphodiesterase
MGRLEWLLLGLAFWSTIVIVVGFVLARTLTRPARFDADGRQAQARIPGVVFRPQAPVGTGPRISERPRILVVDDDPSFRSLLVATLAGAGVELAEAETAAEARAAAFTLKPHIVLLDVSLPDANGLVFCAELQELDDAPKVVLLTGADISEEVAHSAGAVTVLQKPFSPLALLQVIDRLTAPTVVTGTEPLGWRETFDDAEQLMVYARDLARVVEVERAQRQLLESAYRQTVSALVSALEARDTGTNLHSLRVTRYALELAGLTYGELLNDPTVVYGFLLHDIGKVGIPDSILLKAGSLDPRERGLMERHPEIGEAIVSEVAILQGEGLGIVRSHHEHWDGTGYPDHLVADAIPRGARVFAVADALDAITTDRPYRKAREWTAAIDEIGSEAGRQFDPHVVEALLRDEPALRIIHDEIAQAA